MLITQTKVIYPDCFAQNKRVYFRNIVKTNL
jgi:hypothetical protein